MEQKRLRNEKEVIERKDGREVKLERGDSVKDRERDGERQTGRVRPPGRERQTGGDRERER